ncbi:hypothetical protein CEXT_66651 [Caerostris extrusa]|uniref:Peptidase S1 domain-containing protein n=1 Tax=Caerostris extrusa TaxID=172846 RepID=A0AAV4MJ30_CAEEX|nr:hypothetical protein CEXT_66651 [Caerostris extrusa]
MLQTERITGGSQTSQGQFPWTAALYNDDTFACTASIISTTAVLTAAHCVVYNEVQMQPKDFNAIVGNVNRSASDAQQIFFAKLRFIRENENNVYPEILRYVRQRVVSNFNCMVLYLGKTVPDTLLCASGILSGACSILVDLWSTMLEGNQFKLESCIVRECHLRLRYTKLGPAGFTRVSSYTPNS